MKNVVRSLIVILSLLTMVMAAGCPTKDDGDDDGNGNSQVDDGRTVAAEFRGIYRWETATHVVRVVNEKEIIGYTSYGDQWQQETFRWPAWTVENELWIKGNHKNFANNVPEGITEFKLGYFETGKFIQDANSASIQTYIKQ